MSERTVQELVEERIATAKSKNIYGMAKEIALHSGIYSTPRNQFWGESDSRWELAYQQMFLVYHRYDDGGAYISIHWDGVEKFKAIWSRGSQAYHILSYIPSPWETVLDDLYKSLSEEMQKTKVAKENEKKYLEEADLRRRFGLENN